MIIVIVAIVKKYLPTLFYAGATALTHTTYGDTTGPIWLNNIQCVGDEARLIDCPTTSPIGSNDCLHTQDAAVGCRGEGITGKINYHDKREGDLQKINMLFFLRKCSLVVYIKDLKSKKF